MTLFISYQDLGIDVPNATSGTDNVYLDVYTISGINVYGTTITATFSDGSPDLIFDGGNPMNASNLARRLAGATNKNKVVWDGTTL